MNARYTHGKTHLLVIDGQCCDESSKVHEVKVVGICARLVAGVVVSCLSADEQPDVRIDQVPCNACKPLAPHTWTLYSRTSDRHERPSVKAECIKEPSKKRIEFKKIK